MVNLCECDNEKIFIFNKTEKGDICSESSDSHCGDSADIFGVFFRRTLLAVCVQRLAAGGHHIRDLVGQQHGDNSDRHDNNGFITLGPGNLEEPDGSLKDTSTGHDTPEHLCTDAQRKLQYCPLSFFLCLSLTFGKVLNSMLLAFWPPVSRIMELV